MLKGHKSKQIAKKRKETKSIIPKWMECVWRRVPCGQNSCPICGQINRDRQRHLVQGADPDSMAMAMEDVGHSLKEALMIIKADAASKGIDITNIDDIQEPPPPEAFPLYVKIFNWRRQVFKLLEPTDDDTWTKSEAGQDLLWYCQTLCSKTYRQLCNRWHLDNGDSYGREDMVYTDYVLKECLAILKKSLTDLIKICPQEKKKFNLLYLFLTAHEKEITSLQAGACKDDVI